MDVPRLNTKPKWTRRLWLGLDGKIVEELTAD